MTPVDSWVGKIRWRRSRLPTPVFLGFPCGSAGKESTCNAGDLGSIPGLGRSPGEGNNYPFHYSGLENSMDFIVHEVTKSRTQLIDFHTNLPGNKLIYLSLLSFLESQRMIQRKKESNTGAQSDSGPQRIFDDKEGKSTQQT